MKQRASTIENRKELRDRILDVALKLFSANGFKAVKMDDVARALGISKRTLYETYPNKEDLIYEAFKRNIERDMQALKEKVQGDYDTMDILAEIFKHRIHQMRNTNPCILEEMGTYPRVKEYIDKIKQEHSDNSIRFYQQGQEEGYIRTDINLAMIREMSIVLTESFFENKCYLAYKPEDIFRTMMTLFLRSVCTASGIKRFDAMFQETLTMS